MYGILVHVTTNILSSWNLSKLNQIFQQFYLLERLESENLILVMPCLVHLSLLKVPLELGKRTRQKQWNLSLRQVLKTTLTLKYSVCYIMVHLIWTSVCHMLHGHTRWNMKIHGPYSMCVVQRKQMQ